MIGPRAGWLAAALVALACGQPPAPAAPEAPAATAAPAPEPDEADARRIAAIQRAVNETGAVRHQCWSLAAADDFRVEGRVVLELSFAAAGGAAAVKVVADEPNDPRLTTCLVELYGAYAWPEVFAPGQVIQLPFSFGAPRAQYTVQAGHVEPATLAGGKLSARVVIDQRNSGNSAGALSVLEITGGLEIALHTHTSAELLYVQSGAGLVYGRRGRARGKRVGAGHAIYIPAGVPHGFDHVGDEPIVLVQLYAPGGPEQRFKGGPAIGTAPVSAEAARKLSGEPIVATSANSYSIAGGKASVAIALDEAITGDPRAYLGVLTAQPGTAVPKHRHPGSTEILLIVEGEGQTWIDGVSYPTGRGTAVQIPANTEHAFEVTGDAPLRAIQFYTPAGPEQRFKRAGGR